MVKRDALRAQARNLTTKNSMGFMKDIILKDSERRGCDKGMHAGLAFILSF